MGIAGLHKAITPHVKVTHVRELAGQRVAVDTSAWLHKSVFTCALDLGLGRTPWTDRGELPPYVEYCLNLAKMLQSHGVKPLLVFDGGQMPLKIEENAKRSASRKERMAKAKARYEKNDVEGATQMFQQCP
ncbi:exonuclease 1 [Pseudoscourfieldia marina]